MAVDADVERRQELLGQRPRRDPGRGLARARALEDVAHVAMAVLERADEVGVAGPRQVRLLDLGLDRPGVHPLLPVRVVAVGDQERDRAAERAPVADPRSHLDRVALDLHPPAAAVTELATRHLAVDPLAVELQPRGQPLDDGDQPGPVRLAGGCEAEIGHPPPKLVAVEWRPGRARIKLAGREPPRAGAVRSRRWPAGCRASTAVARTRRIPSPNQA